PWTRTSSSSPSWRPRCRSSGAADRTATRAAAGPGAARPPARTGPRAGVVAGDGPALPRGRRRVRDPARPPENHPGRARRRGKSGPTSMGQLPGERRTRVLLVAVVVAYVGGLAGLAAAGLYSPVFKTLVVPALLLVALLSNRLVAFLEDWAVFLGGLVLFDALRAWVYATVNALELPLYLGYVVRLEEALFGGATLPTRLQAAWLGARPVGVRERLLVLVHASHFVVFLLFGLALWLCRRPAFARFA